jgi:hypothetical protein
MSGSLVYHLTFDPVGDDVRRHRYPGSGKLTRFGG